MNDNYIEFKKKRELGEILTDTFAFLRTNFKNLFSVLLKTSAIAIVLFLVALVFMTYVYSDFLGSIGIYSENSNIENLNIGLMILSALLLFIAGVVFYGVLFGTILNYIKSYVNNKGIVNTVEVKEGVKKDFLKIIGLSILSNLIIGFGLVLCVIPGIYLYVPMSLVFSILVFRSRGSFDAINDSFQLVKNEWWITFATLLVVGIIGALIGAIFAIPGFIYGIIKGFTFATEGSYADPSSLVDWVSITLSVVGDLIRYFVIYTLTAVSSAFIYFNLNETKHHTGTLEQIDSLGKSD